MKGSLFLYSLCDGPEGPRESGPTIHRMEMTSNSFWQRAYLCCAFLTGFSRRRCSKGARSLARVSSLGRRSWARVQRPALPVVACLKGVGLGSDLWGERAIVDGLGGRRRSRISVDGAGDRSRVKSGIAGPSALGLPGKVQR